MQQDIQSDKIQIRLLADGSAKSEIASHSY